MNSKTPSATFVKSLNYRQGKGLAFGDVLETEPGLKTLPA